MPVWQTATIVLVVWTGVATLLAFWLARHIHPASPTLPMNRRRVPPGR
ncbi:hypothetical protein [Streptomyces sp. NPDC097619]